MINNKELDEAIRVLVTLIWTRKDMEACGLDPGQGVHVDAVRLLEKWRTEYLKVSCPYCGSMDIVANLFIPECMNCGKSFN